MVYFVSEQGEKIPAESFAFDDEREDFVRDEAPQKQEPVASAFDWKKFLEVLLYIILWIFLVVLIVVFGKYIYDKFFKSENFAFSKSYARWY
jgi:magnesium-transporting ATPase (P-type)